MNWSTRKLAIRKAMLNGKMNQTSDNSIIPAAKVGAKESTSASITKYTLKLNPLLSMGVKSVTSAFIGENAALLKNA